MKLIPKFIGTVKNGVFITDDENYHEWMQSLDGEKCQLIVEKYRESASDQQRKYYFGVVVSEIKNAEEEATGKFLTIEQMHHALMAIFQDGYEEIFGKRIRTIKSLSDLNSYEMSEHIEKCKRLALTRYGIVIPDSDKIKI